MTKPIKVIIITPQLVTYFHDSLCFGTLARNTETTADMPGPLYHSLFDLHSLKTIEECSLYLAEPTLQDGVSPAR